jgi:hypothetical protein
MSDMETLREPQRHRPHAEVPAPVPRPWPTRPVSLRICAHRPFQIAGRRPAKAAGPSAASSEASIAT